MALLRTNVDSLAEAMDGTTSLMTLPYIDDTEKTETNTLYRHMSTHRSAAKEFLSKVENTYFTEPPSFTAASTGIVSMVSAARDGDLATIQRFVAAGADVSIPDENYASPLYHAADAGRADAVRLLLETGADASTPNNQGWTPLMMASNKGFVSVVRLLLQNSADTAMVTDGEGYSALHCAAGQGHDIVVAMLLYSAADATITDCIGYTPLYTAVSKGHLSVVEELLQSGGRTQVNIPNSKGWTPLFCAVAEGQPMVKLLLDNGAEPTLSNNNGWTPLYMAVSGGRANVAKELLQRGGTAQVNVANDTGRTPLCCAASKDMRDTVKLLLDNGADIGAGTPLIDAARAGRDGIMKMLLAAGAGVNKYDEKGMTALCCAVEMGSKACVSMLLDAHANVTRTDKDGWTALHYAANGFGSTIVEMLLIKSPNIDAIDNKGRTALHVAAAARNSRVVEILVQNGANCTIADDEGLAPIDHAALHVDGSYIVRFLLDAIEEAPSPGIPLVDATHGHSESVYVTAFSPDNRWLANASGAITKVFSVATWELASAIHTGKYDAMAFVPETNLLAVATQWRVTQFDVTTGKKRHEFKRQGDTARAVALSPDCTELAVAIYERGEVYMWNLASDSVRCLQANCAVDALAYSHDGKMIACALRVWDAETGALVRVIGGHTAATFAPSGKSLVTAGKDGRLHVWDAENWTLDSVIPTYKVLARTAVGVDGGVVAIAKDGEAMRLFGTTWLILGGQGSVTELAFSSDGRYLASAAEDGSVFVRDCGSWRLVFALRGVEPENEQALAGVVAALANTPHWDEESG